MSVKNIALIIKSAVVVMSLILWLLTACTGRPQIIQGIVQEVDAAKGMITIQTKDGDTVKASLDSATRVQIGKRDAEVINLEPGLSVQVQTEGKTVRLIEVNLAQVDGTIMLVGNNEITLQPLGSNQQLNLKTKTFSIIRQNDSAVALNYLKPGRIAKVYFNTVSGTAYEVSEMPEGYTVQKAPEGSRVEGIIVRIRMDQVSVATVGGLPIPVLVKDSTKITFRDKSPATRQDLKRDLWITAYFSPATRIASQIEIDPTRQP